MTDLCLVGGGAAFAVMATVVAIDAWLLYRFFSRVPLRVVTHAA